MPPYIIAGNGHLGHIGHIGCMIIIGIGNPNSCVPARTSCTLWSLVGLYALSALNPMEAENYRVGWQGR